MDKDGYHGYDNEEQDPDELTMSYLRGVHDGKKQRTWVGLTDEEIKHIEYTTTCQENESWLRNLTRNLEAKLKEKNNG